MNADTGSRSYYEILGLNEDADTDALNRAYNAKVEALQGRSAEDRERVELKRAYEVLIDDEKRREYERQRQVKRSRFQSNSNMGLDDILGEKSKEQVQMMFKDTTLSGDFGTTAPGVQDRVRASPMSSSSSSSSSSHVVGGVLSSSGSAFSLATAGTKTIASNSNNNNLSFSNQNSSGSLPLFPSKGRSLKTTLVISVTDSAAGGVKTILVNRMTVCPVCSGGDRSALCARCGQEKRVAVSVPVQVQVPAGVVTGHVQTYAGFGDVADDLASPAGDLQVVIHVEPHPFLRRVGNDCHADLPLSMVQAALGCKLRIPSLYGQTLVTVTPGTQPGEIQSLPGEGFPVQLGAEKKGNMVVRVIVEIPRGLAAEEIALLRQFDKTVKARMQQANGTK